MTFRFKNVLVILAVCITVVEGNAQVYPNGFGQVLVTNGISNPTAMAFAPDGRIFVAQQAGSLRVIKNNGLLPTPFVSLSVNSSGERGLIGIALDPAFATNNYIYLYYSVTGSPAHNRVSRFTANGDVALSGSETIILELDNLSSATNHNGGAMHFGKDGQLYVAVGENANGSHAQNLDTYHGKLLRINKDGTVPEGNPFTTGSEQRRRVWAYGLRNPYTFSVHPVTGKILVNDVGQSTWEEINDATTGGKNFGWPTTEGYFNTTTFPGFTNPVYVYGQGAGDGKGCAITGGTFFFPTASNYPQQYIDKYFFQDLCNAWINTIDHSGVATRASFATAIPGNGLSLTAGIDGNLYFLSRNNNALYKIIYNNSTIPFITNQPSNVSVAEGQTATFSVSALGSTPLTYQWLKDGIAIAGATSSIFTISAAVPGNIGTYSVVVSNAYGSITSSGALLAVQTNTPPIANITSPLDGALYVAGNDIAFSGTGTDAEDGAIPAAAMSWNINFHHDTHKHDEPAIQGVASGVFTIPVEGETSDNVWYRIILSVTDTHGLISKDSVDIFPRKSNINLVTVPQGLQLTIDGQPVVAPVTIVSVEGIKRTLGVITPQTISDVTYEFVMWSNEGDVTQILSTPTDDLTLVAHFSTIVGIERETQDNPIALYPNPSFNGEVTLLATSTKSQPITINMVDVMSREVVSLEHILQAGENKILLTYGNVKPGIYSIILNYDGQTVGKRFSVTR